MSIGSGADGAASPAVATGPSVEALTRRLIDTPRDLLAEPVGAPDGQVVVAAVVSDVLRLHGGTGLDTVTAAPFRLPPAPTAVTPDGHQLAAVRAPRGRGCSPTPASSRARRPDLVLAVPHERAPGAGRHRAVGDAGGRPRPARGARPPVRARPSAWCRRARPRPSRVDRLATLDSAERARVLAATREAEQRAEEVRQAMHAAAGRGGGEGVARMMPAWMAATRRSRGPGRRARCTQVARDRLGAGEAGRCGSVVRGGPAMSDGVQGEPLTEERRPLIDADGRRLLESLLEHRHAPRYNHTCGDRLTAERPGRRCATLDARTRTAIGFRPGQPPPWVAAFVARVASTVPAYRRGPVPARFERPAHHRSGRR